MKEEQCRCKNCDKLLLIRTLVELRIKCPRCNTITHFNQKERKGN